MPSQLQDIQSGGTPYTMTVQQLIAGLKGTIDISEIVAFPQISPPSTPVTLTTAGSGNLNGTYQYAVAFVTGFWTIDNTTQLGTLIQSGNTGGGATASISVTNASVLVSNIPIGPSGTVARVIYRTKAGGSTFYQVATIYNNQQTTYTDNTPDSSLTVQMPTANTTGTKFVGDGSGLYNLPLPTIVGGTGISATTSGNTETISLEPASSATIGGVELPPSAGSPSTPVVPYRAARVQEQQITTTSQTTVLSYAPAAQGLFSVKVYARVVTAATNVTITIAYTSPSGAKTITVVSDLLGVDDWEFLPQFILATTGSPIAVNVTAETANQVYVSAVIEGV